MDTNLNDVIPIYMQIIDKIRNSIISGELKAGEKVSSVRDLAETFGVNPNTMQRALAELERDGLLESERTIGRFVTKDTVIIEKIRKEEARRIVHEFLLKMKSLGYSKKEIESFFAGNEIVDFGNFKGAV